MLRFTFGKRIILGIVFISLSVLAFVLFIFNSNEEEIGKRALIANIPFEMEEILEVNFPDLNCNIKDYGAIGDGSTLNTDSIKKAIEDCSEKGGGTVLFPKGEWLTGAIHLKSNVAINIEKDSRIIFSTERKDYLPVVFTRYQGIELYNYSPPIYAKDCENIAIIGQGEIIGNGEKWKEWSDNSDVNNERDKLYKMAIDNAPVEERIFGTEESGLRPSFIQFINCKNILLRGIKVENGPMWTIHPVYSENIIIDNINVSTYSGNTDGIAIDSSKNVIIKNSTLSTGDDVIVIKSGLEEDGWRVNKPSENILIENCKFFTGHGAIAIGSEMSGGVRNIFAHNNTFTGTENGFRIKSTASRGGFIENIWIKDIVAENILNDAVVFNLEYNSKLEKDTIKKPLIKNITIQNFQVNQAKRAIKIIGLPDLNMENILIENMQAIETNSSRIENSRNITLRNLNIIKKVKEDDDKPYSIKIENSQNILFDKFKCKDDIKFCISVEGDKNENIDLSSTNIRKEKINFATEASLDSIILGNNY